jgi:hypothetical protein
MLAISDWTPGDRQPDTFFSTDATRPVVRELADGSAVDVQDVEDDQRQGALRAVNNDHVAGDRSCTAVPSS